MQFREAALPTAEREAFFAHAVVGRCHAAAPSSSSMTTRHSPAPSAPTACTCRPGGSRRSMQDRISNGSARPATTEPNWKKAAALGLDYALLGAVKPPEPSRASRAGLGKHSASWWNGCPCRCSPWAGSRRTTCRTPRRLAPTASPASGRSGGLKQKTGRSVRPVEGSVSLSRASHRHPVLIGRPRT